MTGPKWTSDEPNRISGESNVPQSMFTSDSDQLPPASLLSRNRTVAILSAGMVLLGLFLVTSSNLLTRGEVSSLPLSERELLDHIQQMGVRVKDHVDNSFGAPPHVVVQVNWVRSTRDYAITRMTVITVQVDRLLPEFQKLKNLEQLRLPYVDREGIEKVRRRLPGIEITQ